MTTLDIYRRPPTVDGSTITLAPLDDLTTVDQWRFYSSEDSISARVEAWVWPEPEYLSLAEAARRYWRWDVKPKTMRRLA
jgi:hypothetical protein